MNEPAMFAGPPAAPAPTPMTSTARAADAAARGPVHELLDHLLAELRQLDLRCCQLERLAHDLAILVATTDADSEDDPSEGEGCLEEP